MLTGRAVCFRSNILVNRTANVQHSITVVSHGALQQAVTITTESGETANVRLIHSYEKIYRFFPILVVHSHNILFICYLL